MYAGGCHAKIRLSLDLKNYYISKNPHFEKTKQAWHFHNCVNNEEEFVKTIVANHYKSLRLPSRFRLQRTHEELQEQDELKQKREGILKKVRDYLSDATRGLPSEEVEALTEDFKTAIREKTLIIEMPADEEEEVFGAEMREPRLVHSPAVRQEEALGVPSPVAVGMLPRISEHVELSEEKGGDTDELEAEL